MGGKTEANVHPDKVMSTTHPHSSSGHAPLGSVIIVSHNGGAMLMEAVRSVLAQTVVDRLEIIIVDNGSTDGSMGFLESAPGHIRIIKLDRNQGFAGGNNAAFAVARGEYLLLLNNDAVAHECWAAELIKAARTHPQAGMFTSKILFYADRERIDNVGHNIFPDGLNRSRGHNEKDHGQYDLDEETLFASGCAALYRRDKVLAWAGFDEDFFAYGDDADLGLKFRLDGLSCRYVPTAVVYHHGSATAGPYTGRKIFLVERNRVWILIKYFPVSWILASPGYSLARFLKSYQAAHQGRGLAGQLATKNSLATVLTAVFQAWLQALLGLPRMIRKRKELMSRRTVDQKAYRNTLRRFKASLEDISFGV